MTDTTHAPQKYEVLAATYDRRWRRYHAETFGRAVHDIQDHRPLSILDAPCGTGELIRWLLPKVPKARIVGIDGSEAMLRIARQK